MVINGVSLSMLCDESGHFPIIAKYILEFIEKERLGVIQNEGSHHLWDEARGDQIGSSG
jgi:hypothetical protein